MTDGELGDFMLWQKQHILKLISEHKLSEAEECFKVSSKLWEHTGYITGFREVLFAIRAARKSLVQEAKKSFSEEVRITGR
jgi:hypothetical protein